MKYRTKHLKQFARYDLTGRLGTAIGASVIVVLVSFVTSMLTGPLFSGSTTFSYVMREALNLVISIILGIFSAGLAFLYMNMARHREYSLSDLLWFAKNQPDRVLIASAVFSLIGFATGLPAEIYGNVFFPRAVTQDELMNMLMVYMGLYMLGIVLTVILTVPFTYAYNVLADDESLGGFEALKKSAKLMKGNIRRYLILELSFLPLLILSVFAFYLPLLIVVPYMTMSETELYLDLTGELSQMHEGGPGPVPTSSYSDEYWS